MRSLSGVSPSSSVASLESGSSSGSGVMEEVASPIPEQPRSSVRPTAEDLAEADEQHRRALAAASGSGGPSSSESGDRDGPVRVAAYLEARARLDHRTATR